MKKSRRWEEWRKRVAGATGCGRDSINICTNCLPSVFSCELRVGAQYFAPKTARWRIPQTASRMIPLRMAFRAQDSAPLLVNRSWSLVTDSIAVTAQQMLMCRRRPSPPLDKRRAVVSLCRSCSDWPISNIYSAGIPCDSIFECLVQKQKRGCICNWTHPLRDRDRIQTCNRLIRSQLLYSVELRGLFV